MKRTGRIIFPVLLIVLILCNFCQKPVSVQQVVARNGIVASVDSIASAVGIDILKKGGNAVDASVAVGFALAVTFPPAGNIGGGGFMVLYDPATKKSTAIDFRETAPGKAGEFLYFDKDGKYIEDASTVGCLAAGIPGTVRGLSLAHEKYGKLPFSKLVKPAVSLAKNGFHLSKDMADWLNQYRNRFMQFPATAEVFVKDGDGTNTFKPGEMFVQADLGRTLERIMNNGPDEFYSGEVAKRLVDDVQKNGGIFTREDLQGYHAKEREPLRGIYHDYEIITMPPPSSGGITLLQTLNILEEYPLTGYGYNTAKYINTIAEAMKLAYHNRAKYLGDTDFVGVPVDKLISKEYADELRKTIKPDGVLSGKEIGKDILSYEESEETTHFSIIDKDGMSVSVTYTLNGWFGCYQVAKGTGVLLNNEMDDFNTRPGLTNLKGTIGTKPNLIAANKRMLSSMTPTLVLKNGKPYIITGSPGGRTIINVVLCVILSSMEYGTDINKTVQAPRFHHQWMPDKLVLEKEGFSDSVIRQLKDLGYTIEFRDRLGDAHSILVNQKSGEYYGAADMRRNGMALGY